MPALWSRKQAPRYIRVAGASLDPGQRRQGVSTSRETSTSPPRLVREVSLFSSPSRWCEAHVTYRSFVGVDFPHHDTFVDNLVAICVEELLDRGFGVLEKHVVTEMIRRRRDTLLKTAQFEELRYLGTVGTSVP